MPRSVPRNRYMVAIVFLTFFVMSLLTNILGPLVPDIISSFKVSLAAAAFLPFSFLICLWSDVDSRWFSGRTLWRKNRHDRGVPGGHGGIVEFALHLGYRVAVFSPFAMGSGMATLQTAINPLLRVSGGEAHFAFNSAFAHLVLRKRLVSQCVYVFIFGPEPG